MASEIIRLSETYFSIAGKLIRVDQSEAHRLLEKKWHINNSGYVAHCYWSSGRPHIELLHRALLQAEKGQSVDHADGNRLNNQISNLRICTHTENMRNRKMSCKNSAGFKGVRITEEGRFRARITVDKVVHSLGTFDTAESAHSAYCEAAFRLHGEFARIA